MIVVDSNGKYYDQTIKSETDACFKVSGDGSNWKYKKIRCPRKAPKLCGDI